MTYQRNKNRRFKSLISVWTPFAFVVFFFYIIGDLVIDWWSGAWWVWLILGFSLIGAISTTFRYLASGSDNYSTRKLESEYSSATEINQQSVSSSEQQYDSREATKDYTPTSVNFCKNCGGAIDNPSQFCASCGEEL